MKKESQEQKTQESQSLSIFIGGGLCLCIGITFILAWWSDVASLFRGTFGIIANSTEPFCSSCTRLRLSADGKLYGCLSNTRCHDISELLQLPQHQALSQLQTILYQALSDKQESSFSGEETVMKFIGG